MASCSCCKRFIRWVAVKVNILLGLIGMALLILGVWARTSPASSTTDVLGDSGFTQAIVELSLLIIICGAILFFASIIGCVGVCYGSRCYLAVFLILCLASTVVCIIGSVYLQDGQKMFVYRDGSDFPEVITRDDWNHEIAASLKSQIDLLQQKQKLSNDSLLFRAERKFSCCGGANGPTDYGDRRRSTSCREAIDRTPVDEVAPPCLPFLEASNSERQGGISYWLWGIAAIFILGIIVGLLMCCVGPTDEERARRPSVHEDLEGDELRMGVLHDHDDADSLLQKQPMMPTAAPRHSSSRRGTRTSTPQSTLPPPQVMTRPPPGAVPTPYQNGSTPKLRPISPIARELQQRQAEAQAQQQTKSPLDDVPTRNGTLDPGV